MVTICNYIKIGHISWDKKNYKILKLILSSIKTMEKPLTRYNSLKMVEKYKLTIKINFNLWIYVSKFKQWKK